MDAKDEVIRMVDIGRPVAWGDDLVLTVHAIVNGKAKVGVKAVSECGVALLRSRIGRTRRHGKPPIRGD